MTGPYTRPPCKNGATTYYPSPAPDGYTPRDYTDTRIAEADARDRTMDKACNMRLSRNKPYCLCGSGGKSYSSSSLRISPLDCPEEGKNSNDGKSVFAQANIGPHQARARQIAAEKDTGFVFILSLPRRTTLHVPGSSPVS